MATTLETTQGQEEPKTTGNPNQIKNSNAVEMSNLQPNTGGSAAGSGALNDVSIPSGGGLMDITLPSVNESSKATGDTGSSTGNTRSAEAGNSTSVAAPVVATTTNTSRAPELSRLDSVAIGPATDADPVVTAAEDTSDPACIITLLLLSGARHPYKLDEKYLSKRNVEVPGVTETGKKDPFSISVYTLKELILREWRDEWQQRPTSPGSIRLIFFGRLLDDKSPLKDCKFNADAPNVVHLSVKPQDIADDEDATKGTSGGRDRGGNESTPGCRCVIL